MTKLWWIIQSYYLYSGAINSDIMLHWNFFRYRIAGGVDPGFISCYENCLLSRCGQDSLPNPRNARHGIFHNYRPWEYDKVCQYGKFDPRDVVLDTGAMHTYFCIYVAQFVKKIEVIDNFYWAERDYLMKEKLMSPEEWIRYVEQKGVGKIKGTNADMAHLPYESGTFDKVLCVSTIEHVLDDHRGIQELARVLKKNGRLLLTTEFNFFFEKQYCEQDNSFLRVYNLNSLKELIKVSNLKLASPLLVEKVNLRRYRKHANAFVCLEK